MTFPMTFPNRIEVMAKDVVASPDIFRHAAAEYHKAEYRRKGTNVSWNTLDKTRDELEALHKQILALKKVGAI